ncbi:MAG: PDZ domain-containing protein [Marinilabiliales bacterium]|nr:MAG: PDZ domain-containing protein [Marinilabiliales bacterium]
MKFRINTSSAILPLVLAVVLIIGMLIGVKLVDRTGERSMFVYPKTDKLSGVINFIEMEYVDSVSRDELVEKTIPELLRNLDPHSMYIPARDLQRVTEPLEGNFEGIGIQFNMLNDTIVVIQTISGGPSERIGIMPGDRIVEIDDSIVAGVGIPDTDIVSMLRGLRGTTVRVGVQRQFIPGLMEFEITRDRIPLYSVDVAYMIDDETGYIKISQFSRTTFREYMEAAEKLNAMGMRKLILDLRGNGGGYMEQATSIADQFLEEGRLIVYTEGKASPRSDVISTSKGINLDTEIIIMIDEWSASASEILAGAIQDNDRGMVVGRRSFGKGLVQNQTMFSDGSALRLTVARYFTPTGRSIQKPYDAGSDEYFNDLDRRFLHGEFDEADSIRFDDSLKFVTPGGNVVFGGGGIMPDVFIPRDTAGITGYYSQVTRQGLVYRFAFDYSDRNRETLTRFDNAYDIDDYLDRQNLMDSFVEFAEEQGVNRNSSEIARSQEIIHTQIKAYIARNIIDNEGFYPIISQIDEAFRKSVSLIREGARQHLTNLQ